MKYHGKLDLNEMVKLVSNHMRHAYMRKCICFLLNIHLRDSSVPHPGSDFSDVISAGVPVTTEMETECPVGRECWVSNQLQKVISLEL